jgi:hypothetical protein
MQQPIFKSRRSKKIVFLFRWMITQQGKIMTRLKPREKGKSLA